jgi:hypothetical protein
VGGQFQYIRVSIVRVEKTIREKFLNSFYGIYILGYIVTILSATNPIMGLGRDSGKDSYKQAQTDYIGGLGLGSIDQLEAEDCQ